MHDDVDDDVLDDNDDDDDNHYDDVNDNDDGDDDDKKGASLIGWCPRLSGWARQHGKLIHNRDRPTFISTRGRDHLLVVDDDTNDNYEDVDDDNYEDNDDDDDDNDEFGYSFHQHCSLNICFVLEIASEANQNNNLMMRRAVL